MRRRFKVTRAVPGKSNPAEEEVEELTPNYRKWGPVLHHSFVNKKLKL